MKLVAGIGGMLVVWAGLVLAAPDGDLELSVLCGGQPCQMVEDGTVFAVAVNTPVHFVLANAAETKVVTAYWVFGDGTVKDGGLTQEHRYGTAGRYEVTVYAFSLDAAPQVRTLTVLVVKGSTAAIAPSDEFLQKFTLWVGAISAALALFFQLFVPPKG